MPIAVHRVEVRPRTGALDPRGEAVRRDAETLGLDRPPSRVETAAVYLIEGNLDDEHVQRLADTLLADPVMEEAVVGAAPAAADAVIEVHPLPGVMDPDAEAVESAIRATLGMDVQVRTARRYDLFGTDGPNARRLADEGLANRLIHAVYDAPHVPRYFPGGDRYRLAFSRLDIGEMDDRQLRRLSRDMHLFLSVPEMKAIREEFTRLGRDPSEIELETIAQTWSEHCVHKTLKATITYRQEGDPPAWARGDRRGHAVNPDGSVTITNLLRSTIVDATEKLVGRGIDWCLSVFVDNAGVVAFDDEHAVCFKVETHNHPSALEPYGGAATGVGGCIRDVIGTGLGARPIAATDVFCVAFPDRPSVPSGCLHPRRVLTQVVAGVRDYGNRMGIPTVNGAVWFHDDYVGNPLVYCGCVGVMPRDMIAGEPQAGDVIVVVGGRTGRDGIHGATFSSGELTGTHADEFSHAVQIGNPVTEKKLLEAVLQARDERVFHAITDCGAGGFSSAVGEMGRHLGAEVHLERAPLKYAGLSPTEIWISEAQERMVLAVPPGAVERLRSICGLHEVELCELGRFGTDDRMLILRYGRTEVGRVSMDFLHDGLPQTVREATWPGPAVEAAPRARRAASRRDALLALLAHPNIASKHWIIRQYDHEVQGRSVVTPLVGPGGHGPSDAAVLLPVRRSTRGLALANGLATGLAGDPYVMALAAIDECVRNLVCVGADPERIALLDNFCWPGCDDPAVLGGLVRAAEGCRDGALAYRAPFISGKDSLNNQFAAAGRTIGIPPTLLISGLGIVPDVSRCVTMDAKRAGNVLLAVGRTQGLLGGSHHEMLFGASGGPQPAVCLERGPATARRVHEAIRRGLVRAAHDPGDGGLLVAAAEMAIGGGLGLDLAAIEEARCFSEEPARYLLEVEAGDVDAVRSLLDGLPCDAIGTFIDAGRLTMAGAGETLNVDLDELRRAWRETLDW